MPPPVRGRIFGTSFEPWETFCDRHRFNGGRMGEAELRHARAVYYGMVTNLDHQLGRLLGQLRLLGDDAETLVLYTSDHGEALGDHGLLGKRCFLECSANVPLIVRPPKSWRAADGHDHGRVCDDLVEWCDLLPTLCDAAGARVPADVTGRSLAQAIRGEAMPPHVMHGQLEGSHMLHDGRHKLLYSIHDGSTLCFDTRNDPHDERPIDGPIRDEMKSRLLSHLVAEGHEHAEGGESC